MSFPSAPDFDCWRLFCERRYDADMRIGPGAQSRPQKTISNELGSACPPKALALPLTYRISARPVGSSPIEITPFSVRLKVPENSVLGTNAKCSDVR
jgi:hypothetical protein